MENITWEFITRYESNNDNIFLIIKERIGYIVTVNQKNETLTSPCPCCLTFTNKDEINESCKRAKKEKRIEGQIVWRKYGTAPKNVGFDDSWFREPTSKELEMVYEFPPLKFFLLSIMEGEVEGYVQDKIKKKASQRIVSLIFNGHYADAKALCEIFELNFLEFQKSVRL